MLCGICDFDTEHIFECGQSFRFDKIKDGYEGVAMGEYLRVTKKPEGYLLYPCTPESYEKKWRHYFDLDRDYACLFAEAGPLDSVLKESLSCGWGLRIINQPPFETLISFIVSANNNVGRIRKIVRQLCETFGEPFCFEGRTFYRFPTPAALARAKESALLSVGAGYRAPYIKKNGTGGGGRI